MEKRKPFHFSEYLDRLPGGMVYERFVKGLGKGRKIVSASTISGISARFLNEKNLREAFSRLSKDAQFGVSLAYLFGDAGLPIEYACRFVEKSPQKGKKSISSVTEKGNAIIGFDNELINSFLVYAAEDTAGKMYYVGFDEFEPKLKSLIARTIVLKTRIHSPKDAHVSAPSLCVNDIAVIVALASQGRLIKTKTGPLSKASEQQVKRLLHCAHAPFDSAAGQMQLAALAIEYAHLRGLLSLRGEQYIVDHSRMCTWILRPVHDLQAEIVDFAFSHLPLWRKDLVHEMLSGPDNPWLSCMAFGEELKERVFANVKILAYYGLVEYQKSQGDLLFRGSRRHSGAKEGVVKNRQAADVMVQPDFTAILPQETSPEHLYWFSKVGCFESIDKVYKGKIAKDIISDALANGIEGNAILAFLKRWQSSENVMETVKEWIREFSQVFMETGAIVASMEEKVTKRLCSFGPLAGCLRPVRAHCIFRVVKGREEEAAKILSEMGFDHRSPMLQQPENADHSRNEPDMPADVAADGTGLSPVFDFEKSAKPPALNLQQGKYSSHLKALELTEVMHVVEYSLLMGALLRIEYGGSPALRKGVYLVRPLHYQKGAEPVLEAEIGRGRIKKIFLLERILKIGVESCNE